MSFDSFEEGSSREPALGESQGLFEEEVQSEGRAANESHFARFERKEVLSVALSAALHTVALATLWFAGSSLVVPVQPTVAMPAVLKIGLQANNPYAPLAPSDAPAQSSSQAQRQEPFQEPVKDLAEEPESALLLESAAAAVEREHLRSAPATSALVPPAVLLTRDPKSKGLVAPSTEAINSALSRVNAQDLKQRGQVACTAQQELSELFDCAQSKESAKREAAYSALSKNSTYDAFVRVLQVNRSERAVQQIASEAGRVGEALEASSLPAGTSAYLLEEVQATISLVSSSENRTLKQMNRVVDKSAASAMADRILNDPWLQNVARESRARRVVD